MSIGNCDAKKQGKRILLYHQRFQVPNVDTYRYYSPRGSLLDLLVYLQITCVFPKIGGTQQAHGFSY